MAQLKGRLSSLEAEFKDLGNKFDDCRRRVSDADADCQQLTALAGQLDTLITRSKTVDKQRREEFAKVKAQQRILKSDYGRARQAATRAEICLREGDNQQDNCDPAAIARAYAEANAAYGKQSYATARRNVHEILAKYGGCPGVADKIERDEGLIDTMVGGGIKVGTAIDDCDVPRMRNQISILERKIDDIEQGRTRGLPRTRLILLRWIDRLNDAIDKCEKITASANTGGSSSASPSAGGGAGAGGGSSPSGGATGHGKGDRADAGGARVPGAGESCDTKVYAYAVTVVPKVSLPHCAGPCPASPGWTIPGEARCRPDAPTTAGSGVPVTTSAASTPSKSPPITSSPPPSRQGATSGCGPYPNCGGDKRCKPVKYQCLNGDWIGGHCICEKSVFEGQK